MQTLAPNAQPSSKSATEATTALYLLIPEPEHVAADRLSEILKVLPVAAALFVQGEETPPNNDKTLSSHIQTIQNHDIAAMVSNDAKLATEVGADGVHVHWRASIVADFEATRARGGGALMIGADAGKSRHDAMVLAEAGADYIGFGVPDTLKDQETARARQTELIAWWAEVFEVPVVAFDIHGAEQAQTAKAAGADFLAVTLPPHSADETTFLTWLDGYARVLAPDGLPIKP